MKRSDFKIGKDFFTAAGRWMCTDIGTRTIAAIRKDKDDPSWYNGPPYAIVEEVFDECDFGGCLKTYAGAVRAYGKAEMMTKRKPTTPGELLNEEFLKPMKITRKQIAEHLSCKVTVINQIINGRTSVNAEMAIRMAAVFGTTCEFWLNAQQVVDIYEGRKQAGKQRPKLLWNDYTGSLDSKAKRIGILKK